MKTTEILNELNEAANNVVIGETDALATLIEYKRIEKALAMAIECVKEDALKEAAKYGEKTFSAHGATITKSEGKRMFSYKHIPEWNTIEATKKRLEDLAKFAAQKDLASIVDEGTGETVQAALVSYQKESLSITINS